MRRVFATTGLGGVWSWLLTAAMVAGASAPALAGGTIYSWRTEDGGYAYTDDPKAIPARYRDQVEKRPSARLEGYARYTPQNEAATEKYSARLGERVDSLRALNDEFGERSLRESEAAAPSAPGAPDYITLRTGRRDRGGVDVAVPSRAAGAEEPLTVETVWVRLEGSSVIQPVQVTMRGDRVVAINKPRARNWNISDPIDEADLLEELQQQ